METFWIGVSSLLIWFAILALIAAWSRKDHWGRVCVIVLFIAAIPLTHGMFGHALGNHRPISWEQLTKQGNISYLLLAHKFEHEKAIYLYLDRIGPPLALVLPWDMDTAEALQQALNQAGVDGDVMVDIPYEKSIDENPIQFHALPQPKFLPDKPIDNEPAPYDRGA